LIRVCHKLKKIILFDIEEGRRKKEEGRRKREDAIKSRVGAIKNINMSSAYC
jgi:hypothetical protein